MAEGRALASASEVAEAVEAAEVQAAGLGLQAVPSGCSRINVGSALINWKSDDQTKTLIAGFFFAHLVNARKKGETSLFLYLCKVHVFSDGNQNLTKFEIYVANVNWKISSKFYSLLKKAKLQREKQEFDELKPG